MKRALIENIFKNIKEIYPHIYLSGPKYSGKKQIAFNLLKKNSIFLSLEDISKFKEAKNNPERFLENIKTQALIDEALKIPKLLEILKKRYYQLNSTELKYVITSSQKIDDKYIPKEIKPIEVYSLTIKEKHAKNENVIDCLIQKEFLNKKYEELSEKELLKFAIKGGFPEVQKIKSEKEKYFWYSEYVWNHFFKDTVEFGTLRTYDKLLIFLSMIPRHSATVLNKLDIRTIIGLDNKTQQIYFNALENLYHIKFLPAKELTANKQYRKTPKFYFLDTGILCHLLGIKKVDDLYKLMNLHEGVDLKNRIIETFVFSELYKHLKYSQKDIELFHAERQDKRVVDFILKHNNDYIAISIKTSSKKLEDMKILSKDTSFKYKILLTFGDSINILKDDIFEVPLSILI